MRVAIVADAHLVPLTYRCIADTAVEHQMRWPFDVAAAAFERQRHWLRCSCRRHTSAILRVAGASDARHFTGGAVNPRSAAYQTGTSRHTEPWSRRDAGEDVPAASGKRQR